MRKVRRLLVVSILAVMFCLPAYQVNAVDCPGWRHEIIDTYYSDYFSTYVGSYRQYCCEEFYYTDGTLDGAYKMREMTACLGPQYSLTCYQKVNGSWVIISCP
jgi:hypothetical protein